MLRAIIRTKGDRYSLRVTFQYLHVIESLQGHRTVSPPSYKKLSTLFLHLVSFALACGLLANMKVKLFPDPSPTITHSHTS